MARYWLAVAAEQGNDSAAEYLIHLAEKVLTDWYHQTAGISPLAEPATGHYYDMTSTTTRSASSTAKAGNC